MVKREYRCNECDQVYLTHEESYTREYPIASLEDSQNKWWEHWNRECKRAMSGEEQNLPE